MSFSALEWICVCLAARAQQQWRRTCPQLAQPQAVPPQSPDGKEKQAQSSTPRSGRAGGQRRELKSALKALCFLPERSLQTFAVSISLSHTFPPVCPPPPKPQPSLSLRYPSPPLLPVWRIRNRSNPHRPSHTHTDKGSQRIFAAPSDQESCSIELYGLNKILQKLQD